MKRAARQWLGYAGVSALLTLTCKALERIERPDAEDHALLDAIIRWVAHRDRVMKGQK